MADDARIEAKASQEVIRLWADKTPPRVIADVGPEAPFSWPVDGGGDTVMLRNISDPTLTVFRPVSGKANGIGVIVAPGGGWRILAWQHEGIDLAEWLVARGYTAFLLKYRVMGTPEDAKEFAASRAPNPKMIERIMNNPPPRALAELMRDGAAERARHVAADDGRRALELVRERASDWGVKPDRIGMIGFSAGAFLTVDVAMEPGGAPLLFAAPIYGGETSGRPVAADAPPLFTCIAQDDRMLFKVVEGLYADWSNADRPAELHIFAKGGHGFGMVRRGKPVDRWIDIFEDWLGDHGFA